MNSHLIPTFSHHIQNLSCGYTDWLFAENKHASQTRPWVIFQASYKVHFILEFFYTLGKKKTFQHHCSGLLYVGTSLFLKYRLFLQHSKGLASGRGQSRSYSSYKVHFILEIFTLGIPHTIMIRITIMLDDRLNQFDHMFSLMRFERSVYEVNYMIRFPCGAAALQLIIRSCSRTPADSDILFRIKFSPRDKLCPLIDIEYCRCFLESGLTVLIHDGPGLVQFQFQLQFPVYDPLKPY